MILIRCLLGFPLRNVCGQQPIHHNEIRSRRFCSCKQKLTLHSPLSAEIQHYSPWRLSQAIKEKIQLCYNGAAPKHNYLIFWRKKKKKCFFSSRQRVTGGDVRPWDVHLTPPRIQRKWHIKYCLIADHKRCFSVKKKKKSICECLLPPCCNFVGHLPQVSFLPMISNY